MFCSKSVLEDTLALPLFEENNCRERFLSNQIWKSPTPPSPASQLVFYAGYIMQSRYIKGQLHIPLMQGRNNKHLSATSEAKAERVSWHVQCSVCVYEREGGAVGERLINDIR